MSERTKDTTVNGRRYQVTKMTPLIASRIHGWLVYVALKFAQEQSGKSSEIEASQEPVPDNSVEKANGTVKMIWLMSPSSLSEEAYAKIQNYALRCVSFYDDATGSAIPVLMQDGRWADKVLEEDALAVNELITTALQFSIGPFFIEGLQRAAATPTPTITG